MLRTTADATDIKTNKQTNPLSPKDRGSQIQILQRKVSDANGARQPSTRQEIVADQGNS